MNDSELLREYLDAAFEALCETHADELDNWLVGDLVNVRERYIALEGSPVTDGLDENIIDLFDEASQKMGDHSLWNKMGAGYEALTRLRRGVR